MLRFARSAPQQTSDCGMRLLLLLLRRYGWDRHLEGRRARAHLLHLRARRLSQRRRRCGCRRGETPWRQLWRGLWRGRGGSYPMGVWSEFWHRDLAQVHGEARRWRVCVRRIVEFDALQPGDGRLGIIHHVLVQLLGWAPSGDLALVSQALHVLDYLQDFGYVRG
jgi:hypothetical protein